MKEKKVKDKKKFRIIEFVVLSLILLVFLFLIIIELAAPKLGMSVWLKDNIWDVAKSWETFKAHVPTIVNCLIYIVLVYALSTVLRMIFRGQMQKSNRTKTVITLLDGFVKYAAAIAIIILILKAFGVNTTALIASVGVLTLVVGLGAQPLIADIIAGMFIIFENEYNVGEIVSIDGFRGTVIEIGIRSTKLLDAAGNIKIINNNNVGDVVNLSRELSLAVVKCDFPYTVPVEKIETLLKKNFEDIALRIPDIVEGPYYKGVSEYKDSNVTITIVAKCKEDNRFQVERDLLKEYRRILTENDIDIDYPHVVVDYVKDDKDIDATRTEIDEARKFSDKQRELSQNMEKQE